MKIAALAVAGVIAVVLILLVWSMCRVAAWADARAEQIEDDEL